MSDEALKIFVVEDDSWYQKLLVHTLSLNPAHDVHAFDDGTSLLKALDQQPQLVTLDFQLPDYDGITLFKKIKEHLPTVEVIVISEQQDIDTAVTLLKEGAYDYLTKTDDIRDRLVHVLNQLGKNKKLEQKVEVLQQEVEQKYDFSKNIIGDSAGLKRVFRLIEKATTNPLTVTITGETGTGKEVIAKAIHYHSDRKKKQFVPVNMGAIPKDLVESELFGHEKGAFTGASDKRIGKFEQADGGTLFLDEIGEMELSLQSKLLRALQEKEITRVGGSQLIKVDCRIIVATHRNLPQQIKEGNFREDLYYRLFGIPIELPPLRERGKDVLLLAQHFAKSYTQKNDQSPKSFSKEALQKLMNYGYPGNIRELKSIVELAVVMADQEQIMPHDITFAQKDIVTDLLAEELSMKDYQMKIIRLYLKKYDDDTKRVADKLDIGQSTIYRLLKENPE